MNQEPWAQQESLRLTFIDAASGRSCTAGFPMDATWQSVSAFLERRGLLSFPARACCMRGYPLGYYNRLLRDMGIRSGQTIHVDIYTPMNPTLERSGTIGNLYKTYNVVCRCGGTAVPVQCPGYGRVDQMVRNLYEAGYLPSTQYVPVRSNYMELPNRLFALLDLPDGEELTMVYRESSPIAPPTPPLYGCPTAVEEAEPVGGSVEVVDYV